MSATNGRRRRRRIAVITGSRAEYGLLRSTMEAVKRHANLRLQVVATGMHLLRKFGHTIDEIENDGWHVDGRVKMQSGNDDPLDQAMGLSRGVAGMAKFLDHARTDVVVVLGDRIEALAGALAAVTTGRFIAHIHGGDIAPGDYDDSIRYAITKLAHLHLTATRDASRRVIRTGESRERVHVVGAPGIDRLRSHFARRHRAAPRSGRALIVQHSCGRAAALERRVMGALLRAVSATGLAQTIIYPNSDRGHRGVIEAIDAHRRKAANGSVEVIRSIDRDGYLRMLMDAAVLVGNSSSGIIEAGPAGTPSVNVGSRQRGRTRCGPSVVDAGESSASIGEALARARRKRPITGHSTVYGEGHAGTRIATQLAAMPLTDEFRRKSARR